MKRAVSSLSLCAVIAMAVVARVPAGAGEPPTVRERTMRDIARERLTGTADQSSTELIVDFDEDVQGQEVAATVGDVDGEVVETLPELGGVKVVEVPAGTVEEAVDALAENTSVEYVEPDIIRSPLAIPNDPGFVRQWGLHNEGQFHPIADPRPSYSGRRGRDDADIDAPQAWDVEDGSSNESVIAVLDIGFSIDHNDLKANIWQHPGETPNNNVDDDGNGYVDDVHGWDFTAGGDNNPTDPGNTPVRGHGTHVAAIAAGVADNSRGIAGVCPKCKILPLRSSLRLSEELEAIDYLIGLMRENDSVDIKVLNASFGSGAWSYFERLALDRLGRHGVLTVAAAGNAGLDNDMFDDRDYNGDGISEEFSPLFPASYELPTVLSVAASNDRDEFGYASGCAKTYPRYACLFSNWGRVSVDVAAPGTDMKSAFLRYQGKDLYRTWNGTSMATPVVAGIAGLVAAEHPGYGPMDLKNAIMNSVDKPQSLRRLYRRPGQRDDGSFLRTNGRVNALSALSGDTSAATPLNDGMIAGARSIRQMAKERVTWPADVNDVYKKTLRRNVRYAATLRAGNTRRNINLVVYKPGTRDVWQLEDGCAGGPGRCHVVKFLTGMSKDGTERVEFTARQNKTYYFLVNSYFVDIGYTLRVSPIG